jgi:hypothetical protein
VFETFIDRLPPSQRAWNRARAQSALRLLYRGALTFCVFFNLLLALPENKKPTVGLVAEVGCLRGDLSFAYRAVSPHSGALLQQQQMQAPIIILWFTGRFLSYSGKMESQFALR